MSNLKIKQILFLNGLCKHFKEKMITTKQIKNAEIATSG